MKISVPTYFPDGSVKEIEKEVNYLALNKTTPQITKEDRLSALESAMLSMMGVSTDV